MIHEAFGVFGRPLVGGDFGAIFVDFSDLNPGFSPGFSPICFVRYSGCFLARSASRSSKSEDPVGAGL